MQTHQMRVSDGRNRVAEIRRELFAFAEVIDVFVTGRPDALVVVFVGRPRPGEWSRALRSLGYDIPPRRQLAPLGRARAFDDYVEALEREECAASQYQTLIERS